MRRKKVISLMLMLVMIVCIFLTLTITAFAETLIYGGGPTGNFEYYHLPATSSALLTCTDATGTTHTFSLSAGMNVHIIKDSSSNTKVVYCLEPYAKSLEGDTSYIQAQNDEAWMTKLNALQRNAISLILAYGYPNKSFPAYSTNSVQYKGEWVCATQMLVWEIVCGYRDPTTFVRTNAVLYNYFSPSSQGFTTFINTYDTIVASCQAHTKLPSFSKQFISAAPTYEMTASGTGYTITLTDTNGVLSNFGNFTFTTTSGTAISGLSASVSGNNLTITATSAAASYLASGNVLVKATNGNALNVTEDAVLVWAPNPSGSTSANQAVAGIPTIVDPLPMYFKLKAAALGSIQLTKTVDHGTKDGFTFTVKNSAGTTIGTYTTTSTGVITIDNLPLGNYIITETSNTKSVSYVIPASKTVTVSSGQTTAVTFANYQKQVRVSIQKSEPSGLPYADSRSLAGAVFTVYNSSGGVITTMTTDASGKATSSYFACQSGVYIMETIAPPGYQLNTTKISVPEAAASNCSVQYTTISKTCVENPISGNLSLTKVDADNPSLKIPGATYTVYRDVDGDGKYTAGTDTGHGILTDNNGVYTMVGGLLYGKYLVKETATPGPEYQLDPNYYPVNITTQDANYTVVTSGKDAIYETPTKGSIKLVKQDGFSQTPLEGAGYHFYDADGNQIAELYTDANGTIQIDNLRYGNYTYQEFASPKGYELDDTVYDFSIVTHQAVVTQTRDNVRLPGELIVKKYDTSGTPLQGTTFCLEYSNDGGVTWAPVVYREEGDNVELGCCTSVGLVDGSLTTGEDGIATFSGLRADSVILYRLTETAAPEGHSLQAGTLFQGTLPVELSADDAAAAASEVVDGHIYHYSMYVTAVDGSNFRLPNTGSNSGSILRTVAYISAGVCAICVLTLAVIKQRRKDEIAE